MGETHLDVDFSKLFSDVCLRRERMLSSILEIDFNKVPSQECPIGWADGQKNPATFPIAEISFRLRDGTICNLRDAELNIALKMAQAQGIPQILHKLREMQTHWHAPPNNTWDIIVLNGSQDGLWRIFETFVDSGDPVMVQAPVYFGVIGAIHHLAPDFIEIRQDADGIIPEEVEKICEERIRETKCLPKMLYVNPICANPTGAVLTDERRRKLYKMAQKYDFLIIEDDPYFFLNFLNEQPESFLSMDTDGRVIRLDSFSKIFSAGLRIGIVTAHKDFINKLIIHVENTVMHTSSLSQMLIYKLLETWTLESFNQHLKEIQVFYRTKRDIMLAAAEKHLTGFAEWSVPKGGMFLWIRVTGIEDALQMAIKKLVPNGVFVLPGCSFNYNGTKPDQHFRLCYSSTTVDEVEKMMCYNNKSAISATETTPSAVAEERERTTRACRTSR